MSATPGQISRAQLVLTLATLGVIAALGMQGTISSDACAGMIGAFVAFVTGGQVAEKAVAQRQAAANGENDVQGHMVRRQRKGE